MITLMASTNTTPGDFEGNVAQIKEIIREGFRLEANVIMTPELSIPGYYLRDKIFQKGFVEQNLLRVQEIVAYYDVYSEEFRSDLRPLPPR